jgi:Xaa-Pro aminopeptidase
MMKRRALRSPITFLIVISVAVAIFISAGVPSVAPARAAEPPVIRVTPPAPVFDNAKRLEELASRRKRVADAIGPKAIMILFSAEPRVYTNDIDYQFRQENNLFYLTNLNQQGATLVLMPGNPQTPEILFLPRRNPRDEVWTGHMYSPEEARELSGIKEIWDADVNIRRAGDIGRQVESFVSSIQARQPYRPKPENIFISALSAPLTAESFTQLFDAISKGEASLFLLALPPTEGESREYWREQRFAQAWAKSPPNIKIQSAWPIFSQMRLRKSPMELALMQHAIDISIEAHQRAQAFASQAKWEYEVDAQVLYTFKLRNADNWGYPNIVGCGPNATTLHYDESQGPVKAGELMLMDVGAEYGHYSADVTRTFPVNGKFTKEQAEVYQIVYDAQEAAAKATKPGATLSAVHNAALEVIKDGLLKLGLITDRNSEWQYRLWFMHGTSHWLGMNVHDVGGGSRFEPGMVFTNEPGIYVRLDALDNLPKSVETDQFISAVRPAYEKYKGIGVRIEDDMLVTETGAKWMSASLARSIPDIESFIARARRSSR